MNEPMAYAYCKVRHLGLVSVHRLKNHLYGQYGKLLMRSQIDGEEPSLPRRTFVSRCLVLRSIGTDPC